MVTIVATDSAGPGVRYALGEVDSLLVPVDARVDSTDSIAVTATGSNQTVTVRGMVNGLGDDGIRLGDDSLDSGHRLVNTGTVYGADDAVQFFGQACTVVNSGVLFGNYGVYIIGSAEGTQSTITNTGTIVGRGYAVLLTSPEDVLVENAGFIQGGSGALSSSFGRQTLINTGRIVGLVSLGEDADLYDGRGGTVVGVIEGDSGNDRFIPGLSAERIEGGDDSDTLDFRLSGAVAVSLDGSVAGTGAAAGDAYLGIEVILGSNRGNDRLVGDGSGNTLRGNGGEDVLNGRGGADRLIGDTGRDTLTGATGNDVFDFRKLGDCGDRITDFSRGAGNNDRFEIGAAAFGGGLTAGALSPARFVTRTDNLAQDANDRFIFRTTDQTLWFDANGSAAGGLTLVADLQAGAVVTAADIILV